MKSSRNKCGIGYVSSNFLDAYTMLRGIEHRGQETTGIARIKNGKINVIRWLGEIYEKSFREYRDLEREMEEDSKFLVHTRYATRGSKQELLRDAHPVTIDGKDIFDGENYYTREATSAIVHNGQVVDVNDLIKKFKLKTGSDTELLLRLYKKEGIESLMEQIPASYSMIISDSDGVVGCRDRYGIKPLWYGEKDGLPILCSEDFPIRKIGGKPEREIKPGEIVYIKGGTISIEKFSKPREKFCFFEFNYLADPNSQFREEKVWDVRKSLGAKLAEEVEIKDGDLVMPVPNSGRAYAIGFQEEIGLPYLPELEKLSFKRSFIQSTKKDRERLIEENLYLRDANALHGKSIVVEDDSVIRGNVVDRVVQLLKKAKAKKVYYLSGTPPIGKNENCYCCYGVDMPSEDEFIIRKFGTEERISRYISDKYKIEFKLHYISEEGLFDVLPGKRESYCAQCITGECPLYEEVQI